MRTIDEEVELCLFNFIRLCLKRSVLAKDPLDRAAAHVASIFRDRFPSSMPLHMQNHFDASLDKLVHLVSALSQRLSPELISTYCQTSSEAEVAKTLFSAVVRALHHTGQAEALAR